MQSAACGQELLCDPMLVASSTSSSADSSGKLHAIIFTYCTWHLSFLPAQTARDCLKQWHTW